MADIDEAALAKSASALGNAGATVSSVRLDVSDPQSWADAAKACEVQGPIDVLCNNAGILSIRSPMEGHDYGHWKRVFSINVDGPFLGVKTFLPGMKARGSGWVVNLASIGGLYGLPNAGAYITSKFAVVGMTESLRKELDGTGVGVTLVCPTVVNTAIFERASTSADLGDDPRVVRGRAGLDPDEVGQSIVEAVREGRFYVSTGSDTFDKLEARMNELRAAFAP